MAVSLSVFSFFSAPALSLTVPQALFSAAAFLQTHSITCWECHRMKEQWEPTGEMLSVTTLKYQVLVWDFHQEMKRIGIGAYSWTQILPDSLTCAACLIQNTLQCFDRTLLRLSPNWAAMWPSPTVQIIWMKNVFYQCTKNLKLTNLLWAVYCNFCSIIKPEPLSWTGSLSFAFLWVIHLQTSALLWCITMIDWRVHVIYHHRQQLLDAKDWETEPAVFLMGSHNASPGDGNW